MATASDDEFDALPDDFSGFDFDAVPDLAAAAEVPTSSLPPPTALPAESEAVGVQTHSSASSDYGDDTLDADFLAEVDALEDRAVRGDMNGASGSNGIAEIFTSGGMGTSGFIPSRYFAAAHNAQQTAHIAAQTLPSPPPLAVRPRTPPPKSISSKLKDIENESDTSRRSPRKRSATSPAAPSPTSVKKGKMKANDSDIVRTMLEGFEDEMTCPICCDIFVAAHLGNPCGHTFCGACGYSWISQNKSTPTCATCRAKLSTSSPLIPNFAVDNTVERHIRAMVANGDNEWRDGGKKMKDWSERKETWKKESAARVAAKPKPTRPQSRHRDRVVWVDDEDEQWLVPDGDSEDDGDYQPPPAPVVPAAVGPPPAALHQVVEAYGYLPVADASGSRGRRRNRRRRGGNRGRGG